jgi:hypothetical protein
VASSLDVSFRREVEAAAERIRGAIGPYARFVRTERDRIEELRRRTQQMGLAIEDLATRIRALAREP